MALDTGLISYWKLDETSGNPANSVGSYTCTNTNVTYATGKINNATVFNGSSSYADISTDVLDPTNSFSFSFWFKITSFPTIDHGAMIIGKFNNSGVWNYGIINMGMGNVSPYNVNFSNRDANGIISAGTLISNPVTATWYHVVYVYDKSVGSYGTNYAYLNGSLVFTSANSRYYTNYSNPVRLGKSQDSWQYAFFNGQIDELGFWTRVLTSTEALQLYNGGAGLRPFIPKSSNASFLLRMI